MEKLHSGSHPIVRKPRLGAPRPSDVGAGGLDRRQILKGITAVGIGLLSGNGLRQAFADYVSRNTLNPGSIPKYVSPLVLPPAMPGKSNKNKDQYKIAVRQFSQQILPASFPATQVWSYGSVDHPATFHYPAFTIEATQSKTTQIQWRNELVDSTGLPLPHLLPVDPTLHWANPIGSRDMKPSPEDDQYWENPYLSGPNGTYVGPVPFVTHVHGAHTEEDSDGYPEAWTLPASAELDPYITSSTGTFFDVFSALYGHNWSAGVATFKYPNTQRATTLWFHDHTLGMTRVNVYAGPAGFYLIRGGADDKVLEGKRAARLPGPAPGVFDARRTNPTDPKGIYEIPIVIQDRAFDAGGQLWYPNYRAFFEGLGDDPEPLQIPFTPEPTLEGETSDVAPSWQPEFFGNVMVVNGVSWPRLDVEPQLYRLRLLNGCNSRFLILGFSTDGTSIAANVPVFQIGADGGFLRAPVNLAQNSPYPGMLLLGPAERADILVDFRQLAPGTPVLMLNYGPDEPFGGGPIGGEFAPADPGSTGQVMMFNVIRRGRKSPPSSAFSEPSKLVLPAVSKLKSTAPTRRVSLSEEDSQVVFVPVEGEGDFVLDTGGTLWEVPEGSTSQTDLSELLPGVSWNEPWIAGPFGPTAALLGTLTPPDSSDPDRLGRLWMAPVTENPTYGSTEVWEIHNFTMDAHPIHIHLVQFQVVGRVSGGRSRAPYPGETGFKDTVIAYPGEITRVIARFDKRGRFVWHCHILEHEDNEMMRPFEVL